MLACGEGRKRRGAYNGGDNGGNGDGPGEKWGVEAHL